MVVKRQPENGFLTVSGCLIIGKIGVKNRAELIAAIRTALDRYLAEFADIPEQAKDIRAAAGEKTPSEHLAYQLGWTQLLLQ